MKKKQLLATLVMLSLMQGSVYAADLGKITSNVTLTEDSTATGIVIDNHVDDSLSITGNYKLTLNGNSNSSGINISMSNSARGDLLIDGDLEINDFRTGINNSRNGYLTVNGKTTINNFNNNNLYYIIETANGPAAMNFKGGLDINGGQSERSGLHIQQVDFDAGFIDIDGLTLTGSNSYLAAIEAQQETSFDVSYDENIADSGKISIKNITFTKNSGMSMGTWLMNSTMSCDQLIIDSLNSQGSGTLYGIVSAAYADPSYLKSNDINISNLTANGGETAGIYLQLATLAGKDEATKNNVNINNIINNGANCASFGIYDTNTSNIDIKGKLDIKEIKAQNGMAYGTGFMATQGTVNTATISGIEGKVEAGGLLLAAGADLTFNNLSISDVNANRYMAVDVTDSLLTVHNADIRTHEEKGYQGYFKGNADDESVKVNAIALRSVDGATYNWNNKDGSYSIYGTIVAGAGEANSKNGGTINIGGAKTQIYGDIFAGNGGNITLNLTGSDSIIEGQIDDYHELVNSDKVFHNSAFYASDGSILDVTSAGSVDLTLDNGAAWIARGQSFVDTISLDGGIIDMSQNDNSSVTVDTLSSKNGVLKMKLNTNDRTQSDMLYVTGSMSGNYQLIIDETNFDASKTEIYPLRFATVKGDVDISGINARSVDVGFFNTDYKIFTEDFVVGDEDNKVYNNSGVEGNGDHAADYKPGNGFAETTFDNDDTNLMIGGIEKQTVSDAGQTIINMSRANYSNAIYMDRLNKRMGEARYINTEDEQGMWVRLRHDRIGKEDAFRSQNTMYEMGYDVKQDCDNGDRRVGFAIDYMDGKTEYRNVAGDGDIKRYGLWLYDTWMGDKGHYADYVLKWGHLENDFDIYNSRGKVNGDYSNNVFSVSAEYGKKNDMGNDWYFEPQAQLQLARVTGADYTTSQGTRVSLDGINSLIGRAGFRLGRDVDERSTVYVKADLLHEFLGEQDMHVVDNTFNGSQTFENKGTWYDVGFGFATALGKDSYAFMDFEKSFGNDNDETYQINAGVQWTF